MAINVNTVYTTVLSVLNKEQRGYLTPYEFNQIAAQTQLDIFEKYFIDLDAQLRITQNDFDYSNSLNNLDDVVSTFRCFGPCAAVTTTAGKFSLPITDTLSGKTIVYNDQPSSTEFAFYRLGTVNVNPPAINSKPIEIERLQRNPFYNIDKSDLTAPSLNYPVYLYEGQKIYIKPTLNSIGEALSIQASFLRKPRNPVWGFTIGAVGQYIYDPATSVSVDFEISSNDQTELILQILKYAGVVVRDPQIVQAASAELAQK